MVFKMKTNVLIECLGIILLLISTCISAQGYDACKTYSGDKGTCKEIFNCKSVEKDAKEGKTPKLCTTSSQYNIPMVCCPIESDNRDGFIFGANSGGFVHSDAVPTRKSEAKCKEYSKDLRESVAVTSLAADDKPFNFGYEKCENNGIPLIVGGVNASLGEFPYMAAIGYPSSGREKYNWDCGGTLISEQYVLTAAHCTIKRTPVVVRLGDLDLSSETEGAKYVDYDIAGITNHPDYHYSKDATPHDIALLLLDRKVEFSKFIRPACLNTKSLIKEKTAIATGYGAKFYHGPSNAHLLKVALNVYEGSVCSETYRTEFHDKSMICAGEKEGGKDACNGDSGGPLVVTPDENQCKFYLIGVISFGKGCGFVAGVYTKVSEYIPWIENIVWKD